MEFGHFEHTVQRPPDPEWPSGHLSPGLREMGKEWFCVWSCRDRGGLIPSGLLFCTEFFGTWPLLLLGSLSAPPNYSRIFPYPPHLRLYSRPWVTPQAYVTSCNNFPTTPVSGGQKLTLHCVQAATSLPPLLEDAAMLPSDC